jgi:hypothetical protein
MSFLLSVRGRALQVEGTTATDTMDVCSCGIGGIDFAVGTDMSKASE